MGRTWYTSRTMKRQRHKQRSTRRSRTEDDAMNWCQDRGAYLLVTGVGKMRRWTVYRLADGRELGVWSPVSGRWRAPEPWGCRTGEERHWWDALGRIVTPTGRTLT